VRQVCLAKIETIQMCRGRLARVVQGIVLWPAHPQSPREHMSGLRGRIKSSALEHKLDSTERTSSALKHQLRNFSL
jgi:hypothetical protein